MSVGKMLKIGAMRVFVLLCAAVFSAFAQAQEGGAPPHEIKGVLTEAFILPWWLIVLCVFLSLVLIFLLRRWIRKKRGSKNLLAETPASPSDIYQRLLQHEPSSEIFCETGRQRLYFLEINHLMRYFLASLTSLNAEALTSDELKAIPIPSKFSRFKDQWRAIIEAFIKTERVIFASMSISLEEGQRIHKDFVNFASEVLKAEDEVKQCQENREQK